MTNLSTDLSLPIELFEEIIQLLPLSDQQSLSLVSQAIRKLTLPFIFGHLQYEDIQDRPVIRNIHQARLDVKEVVKKLSLYTPTISMRRPVEAFSKQDETVIFRFLETLPNLRSLEFCHKIPPADISYLIASLRRAPLLEFTLDTIHRETVEGPPTTGLAGLEKLSIIWDMADAADQPGSAHNHLYELIRPSLTTLVDLRIDDLRIKSMEPGTDFDLQLLKPAGNTLRSFKYRFTSLNERILDTIPVIFPHLTTLKVVWCNAKSHSVLWRDTHINALARNQNLTSLALSFDFEVQAGDRLLEDENYSWFVRCYKRRLRATQDVASACVKLERCCWIQLAVSCNFDEMEHPFIIREKVLEGKTMRVVRAVKQYWMGRDNQNFFDGAIVKCKLEDLPGDIIGENDMPNV